MCRRWSRRRCCAEGDGSDVARRWSSAVVVGYGLPDATTWTIEPIPYKELQQDYPHDHICYHGDLKEHQRTARRILYIGD